VPSFLAGAAPPSSFAVGRAYDMVVWTILQASLSVAVLFAAYIAQQRLRPFVAAASLSSSLQVGALDYKRAYASSATITVSTFVCV
jgi:hypothetical protein